MKNLIIQILIIVGLPLLAIYAVFYGSEWADNFITFISIILLVCSILVIATDNESEVNRLRRYSLPEFTLHGYCLTMIALTVYSGWFWLSTVWVLNWLMGSIIKDEK